MRENTEGSMENGEMDDKEDRIMNYDEVVKMIQESEKRVDEVLKAARLERHEKASMTRDKLELILSYAVGTLALIFAAVAVFMIIYFMGTGGR